MTKPIILVKICYKLLYVIQAVENMVMACVCGFVQHLIHAPNMTSHQHHNQLSTQMTMECITRLMPCFI